MCYNTYIVKTNEVNNLDRKKTIEIKCKGADTLPIDRILEFQGELKELSKENEKKLRNSILKFGFIAPLFVWDDKGEWRLLDGHQRLKTLLKMREEGYDIPMLPVDYIEADSEEDAKRKLLHISSQYGEFTADGFENFTFGLDGFEDIRLTNDEFFFKTKEDEVVVEDYYEIPEDIETDIHVGDIFEIGEHRLMCGDSTDAGMVEKLMDGHKADMVFTDPPYGVNYSGGIQFTSTGVKKEQREKLKNDLTEQIYADSIPIMASITNGPIYTWFADMKAGTLYNSISKVGDIHALLIWVKNGGYGAMNANYKQKHEPCLYWKPKNGRLNFIGKSTETTIWDIDKDGKNKYHPTQKPVKLALKAISNHNANLIADLFLGSGSTMVASHQLGRKCYGMELDPKYCKVIIDRMRLLDSSLIIKKNGEIYE